jgi:cytoskeletal protein CcmA (bactofilin family)
MDGILSGFPFSRKKDIAAPDTHKNSDIDRSNSMRLTKNDPAPSFSNDLDSIPDSISSFNSGAASDSSNRVTELARAKPAPTAVIGPKIMFKGELTGEEDLLIQGRVEGSIDLKGNHLTIGSQGVIKANVAARTITVEGSVEGDIVAAEHIAIKSASRVKGNLKAERVTLEDGAKFRGSIDMDMDADSKPENKSSYSSTTSSFVKETKSDESE